MQQRPLYVYYTTSSGNVKFLTDIAGVFIFFKEVNVNGDRQASECEVMRK